MDNQKYGGFCQCLLHAMAMFVSISTSASTITSDNIQCHADCSQANLEIYTDFCASTITIPMRAVRKCFSHPKNEWQMNISHQNSINDFCIEKQKASRTTIIVCHFQCQYIWIGPHCEITTCPGLTLAQWLHCKFNTHTKFSPSFYFYAIFFLLYFSYYNAMQTNQTNKQTNTKFTVQHSHL